MLDKLVITVSQLNYYIKSVFECDEKLKNIFVTGEVSNFKGNYQSGHLYFSLKEGNSVIKAVMFASNANRLRFQLKDGMKIIVRGNVLCYEVNGQYQIYVDDIQPYGIGSYYLEFEQLKEKLSREGLFDNDRKKHMPAYPKKIGVVTSLSGAAVRDIENVLKRRYPIAEMVVYPVHVQGEKAVSQIIDAINKISDNKEVDVIILGRGGGSVEELWTFNNENLARSVSNCAVPIISAVGHETDFTICDFVADKRAPTPSAAAELCVPNKDDLLEEIINFRKRIDEICIEKIENYKCKCGAELKRLERLNPIKKIDIFRNRVVQTQSRLSLIMQKYVSNKKFEVNVLLSNIGSLNPEIVMKRGYSIIQDENGIVKEKWKIRENKNVKIRFSDGEIECKITNIRSI